MGQGAPGAPRLLALVSNSMGLKSCKEFACYGNLKRNEPPTRAVPTLDYNRLWPDGGGHNRSISAHP